MDVADTAVLRGFGFGFGFAFVATVAGVGEDVAVKGAGATVDARAEALAIGEVLPVGVEFPPQSEIPIMSSTMNAIKASPALCSFFIGSLSDGPPLSVRQCPPEARKTTGSADGQKRDDGLVAHPYFDVQVHRRVYTPR